MAKKNKIFSGRSSSFRGSSSKENKDDKKGCFNYKKHGHFIADSLELQKDKSTKESYQKNIFINKFKKSLMATWDELDKKDESENNEEKVNLALIALTFSDAESDSDSEDEDRYFIK